MKPRPLEGIRVLDFTHGVAGPYTAMLLGDMGCDVIKVEQPDRGDSTRYMNVAERFMTDIPRVGGDYFLAVSRNKRSVGIDIKQAEGRALCHRLAGWADIVLQSFRPGVMQRLGLDYQTLREHNPRLIYASLSAYGQDGSLADKPGMDIAVQARSGVMKITGTPGSQEPIRPGASMADFAGGIYLYAAVATALFHRERTGEGQEVQLSLMDATMSMLMNYSVAVMDGKAELGPVGSGHPQLVPYQAFATSDGHVVVAAGTNKVFRELCACLGCPELAQDERFRSNQNRVRHRTALIPLMEPLTRSRTTAKWLETFDAADIPAAPVYDLPTAFEQLRETSPGMVQTVDHPAAGPLSLIGVPFRFSRTEGDIRRPPPMLGEHTLDVLRNVLALDEARIAELQAAKVVG
jgi:crotonobetainyl-CoA:carnitine CoA-transferase CaiB-like acyl-CoA transferase